MSASEQIVCLLVCLYEIFVSFAFGRSGGVTLLLTGVLMQGSCFCCFGPEMNQFEIELPVNSSGLGGSQKLLLLAKMDQFEIELPVNSSGLGVPKTVDFS